MVNINKSILQEHYSYSDNSLFFRKFKSFFSLGQIVKVSYIDISSESIQFRSFTGVCISKSNRSGRTRITLRNIFKWEAIEQSFLLDSPLIISCDIVYNFKRKAPLYKLSYLSR